MLAASNARVNASVSVVRKVVCEYTLSTGCAACVLLLRVDEATAPEEEEDEEEELAAAAATVAAGGALIEGGEREGGVRSEQARKKP